MEDPVAPKKQGDGAASGDPRQGGSAVPVIARKATIDAMELNPTPFEMFTSQATHVTSVLFGDDTLSPSGSAKKDETEGLRNETRGETTACMAVLFVFCLSLMGGMGDGIW
ncbi:hypothetical protein EYF80_031964 [Liparis tanakae]|uniref:Uncharacterized protein n=1 Tax=Liparis tanakae TaxID=230148 RepID=A0A4Z2GX02_9TELE|nr:hypothetical protein EYF80_031964 [Liparis tanakae]